MQLDADQQLQLFLPFRRGGFGLGSAEMRRGAAFLGSWEQCFAEVAQVCRFRSSQALFAAAPQTAAALAAAEAVLRMQYASRQVSWESRLVSDGEKCQKGWSLAVPKAAHKALLARLPEADKADLRSASGPGAGAFLLPPSQADHIMCDAHIQVAMRMRLCAPAHPAEPSL